MKKILKWGAISVVALVVLITVIAVASGGGKSASSPSVSASAPAAASQSAPAAPPSAAATASAASTVTYVVTGMPMRVTATIPSDAPLYYAITAQLQGGGAVSCEILVDGRVISSAQAQSGYNLADCEISKDPLTDQWQSSAA